MMERPAGGRHLWRRLTLLVRRAAVLAARDLARRAGDPGRPADLLALHRADPAHYIWTEEVARFLFVWTIMVGAMIEVRENTHFEVDLWPRLSARADAAVKLIARLGVLVIALVFLWARIRFTGFGWYPHVQAGRAAAVDGVHRRSPIAGATWLIFLGEQMYSSGCSWARPHDRRGAVVGRAAAILFGLFFLFLFLRVPIAPSRWRWRRCRSSWSSPRLSTVMTLVQETFNASTTRSFCSPCRSSC